MIAAILLLIDVIFFGAVIWSTAIDSSISLEDRIFFLLIFSSICFFIGFFIWIVGDLSYYFKRLHHKIIYWNIKGKTVEILKKFKNFFLLNARDKRFVKLGIVDQNNEPTAEGKEIYNLWRFNKDRDDFDKEVAQKLDK